MMIYAKSIGKRGLSIIVGRGNHICQHKSPKTQYQIGLNGFTISFKPTPHQMSCNICADTYNRSTRICIKCPYCDFEVCRTCCETYILSEPTPRCMHPNCYKEWSRKFLSDKLTQVFLNKKYVPHIENILFDKEKALLPAAQVIVEGKLRKKNIQKRMKQIDEEINALQIKKWELERELYGHSPEKAERKEFVRQCPANGCRGFLSTQWKCGICELWTCPDCHEVKGETRDVDHTCDPNNLETARLLDKDSKACPSCHSMIFKISGCNQMFCTMCNTAFDWVTGRISNTNIHNPHYFEWVRQQEQQNPQPNANARAHEENAPPDPNAMCRERLSHRESSRISHATRKHSLLFTPINMAHNRNEPYVYTIDGKPYIYDGEFKLQDASQLPPPPPPPPKEPEIDQKGRDLIDTFRYIIRQVIHLTQVELPTFSIADYVQGNQYIRIAYLEGLVTEEDFKKHIQRNDKRNRKNIEISQVIQFVGTAAGDIIHRIIQHLNDAEPNEYNLEQFKMELDGLVAQANELFIDIARTYKCVKYRLGENFDLIRGERLVGKPKNNVGGGGCSKGEMGSDEES